MRFKIGSMASIGLVAAACLLPLATAIAQTGGDSVSPAQEGMDQIMRVQQDLNANGARLPVNGVMDAATEAALRDYQRQQGLPPTGRIDAQTFTSLEDTAARSEKGSP